MLFRNIKKMDELGFDIYEDLEEFDQKEHLKKSQQNIAELVDKLNKANYDIDQLRGENQRIVLEKKLLSKNCSSLLKTAKNELQRKETEILSLRREKEDICFRRTRRTNTHGRVIQTDITFDNHDATVGIHQFNSLPEERKRHYVSKSSEYINPFAISNRRRSPDRSRSRVKASIPPVTAVSQINESRRIFQKDSILSKSICVQVYSSREKSASSNSFQDDCVGTHHEAPKDKIDPFDARKIIEAKKRAANKDLDERPIKISRKNSIDATLKRKRRMSMIFGNDEEFTKSAEISERNLIDSTDPTGTLGITEAATAKPTAEAESIDEKAELESVKEVTINDSIPTNEVIQEISIKNVDNSSSKADFKIEETLLEKPIETSVDAVSMNDFSNKILSMLQVASKVPPLEQLESKDEYQMPKDTSSTVVNLCEESDHEELDIDSNAPRILVDPRVHRRNVCSSDYIKQDYSRQDDEYSLDPRLKIGYDLDILDPRLRTGTRRSPPREFLILLKYPQEPDFTDLDTLSIDQPITNKHSDPSQLPTNEDSNEMCLKQSPILPTQLQMQDPPQNPDITDTISDFCKEISTDLKIGPFVLSADEEVESVAGPSNNSIITPKRRMSCVSEFRPARQVPERRKSVADNFSNCFVRNATENISLIKSILSSGTKSIDNQTTDNRSNNKLSSRNVKIPLKSKDESGGDPNKDNNNHSLHRKAITETSIWDKGIHTVDRKSSMVIPKKHKENTDKLHKEDKKTKNEPVHNSLKKIFTRDLHTSKSIDYTENTSHSSQTSLESFTESIKSSKKSEHKSGTSRSLKGASDSMKDTFGCKESDRKSKKTKDKSTSKNTRNSTDNKLKIPIEKVSPLKKVVLLKSTTSVKSHKEPLVIVSEQTELGCKENDVKSKKSKDYTNSTSKNSTNKKQKSPIEKVPTLKKVELLNSVTSVESHKEPLVIVSEQIERPLIQTNDEDNDKKSKLKIDSTSNKSIIKSVQLVNGMPTVNRYKDSSVTNQSDESCITSTCSSIEAPYEALVLSSKSESKSKMHQLVSSSSDVQEIQNKNDENLGISSEEFLERLNLLQVPACTSSPRKYKHVSDLPSTKENKNEPKATEDLSSSHTGMSMDDSAENTEPMKEINIYARRRRTKCNKPEIIKNEVTKSATTTTSEPSTSLLDATMNSESNMDIDVELTNYIVHDDKQKSAMSLLLDQFESPQHTDSVSDNTSSLSMLPIEKTNKNEDSPLVDAEVLSQDLNGSIGEDELLENELKLMNESEDGSVSAAATILHNEPLNVSAHSTEQCRQNISANVSLSSAENSMQNLSPGRTYKTTSSLIYYVEQSVDNEETFFVQRKRKRKVTK